MISKLLVSLAFLAFFATACGFVVLAVWDVPVAQETVEKPVDASKFLGKES